MAQEGNIWVNDTKPINMGGFISCPMCGGEVIGPVAWTMSNNKTVRKWSCNRCNYVARIEGGNFKNAFEANPVTFG